MDRQEIIELISQKFNVKPEYLWQKYPNYIVFRNKESNKWFAAILDVPQNKLGLKGVDKVDIIDVKCDFLSASAIMGDIVISPYHMPKGSWSGIILNDITDIESFEALLDVSFDKSKKAFKKC